MRTKKPAVKNKVSGQVWQDIPINLQKTEVNLTNAEVAEVLSALGVMIQVGVPQFEMTRKIGDMRRALKILFDDAGDHEQGLVTKYAEIGDNDEYLRNDVGDYLTTSPEFLAEKRKLARRIVTASVPLWTYKELEWLQLAELEGHGVSAFVINNLTPVIAGE